MDDRLAVDKRRVRRSFDRAAATYDGAAVLQHEVCRRMLERMDYIKCKPEYILDAGAGTGNALPGLAQRYPGASIVALDIAWSMLDQVRRRGPWWRKLPGLRSPVMPVCADIERLPLAGARAGLVWSNLALQWAEDLPGAFTEMMRVLAPGGLLMFSTLGPDTLKELRHAADGVDQHTHVHGFTDLHDIGDMLLACGFSDPVMDMEQIVLTYEDVRALMHDLKAIGAHNATAGRAPGLSGIRRMQALERNYEPYRRDGRIPATYEVIYGHAWKPMPRRGPGGRPVIEIRPAGKPR